MHRVIFSLVVSLAVLVVAAGTASADASFQFAAPNYNTPDTQEVNGVRFSIFHGENQKMRGLDLGFFAMSESTTLSGLRLAMGVSKFNGDMNSGADFSFVNIHRGTDTGLNAAFINITKNPTNAVDFGFVNIAESNSMLDFGGVNVSDSSSVQIGFVNFTKRIDGFQFGFLNFAENGFLPFCPIINFPKDEEN